MELALLFFHTIAWARFSTGECFGALGLGHGKFAFTRLVAQTRLFSLECRFSTHLTYTRSTQDDGLTLVEMGVFGPENLKSGELGSSEHAFVDQLHKGGDLRHLERVFKVIPSFRFSISFFGELIKVKRGAILKIGQSALTSCLNDIFFY
jgi:hypothetical protein